MVKALVKAGADPSLIEFLRAGYFDALEKAVFSNPLLAHWRHQLSLDYLRGQVSELRRRAEEAAGVFSPERQAAALEDYCAKALAAWDIIDLSSLPAGDIHLATQKLLLRQLYMPLRVEVEPPREDEAHDATLARMEVTRETRRRREAFHTFSEEADPNQREKTRAPVGKVLAEAKRLVVLGDPGGGKTTMLRWMATAYLLRHQGDGAFRQVPDTETLPDLSWIPVLIRCRDLGDDDLCRSFDDFLLQHLKKTDLRPEEAEVMHAVILDRIARGEALLLVDGLDEITSSRVRVMFCKQLELTAARYAAAPIVVTSRVVGYRDMPYRMGAGFAHGQIAELSREDKDHFAQRWTEVTSQHHTTDERAKHARELLEALHSSDRIERLTGNPMLLTTLALVKHKVGKLPSKRIELYSEAVAVLLNWNSTLYEKIEKDEALPQLEYLAYEMCRRGVQRLPEEEILGLLERCRADYPNIRPIRRREAHKFLAFLEERSSILIKSGGSWRQDTGGAEPVWEFRHLTFQEYLAALALLDGRYPGRDKTKSLAEQVAPLAGTTKITELPNFSGGENESEVAESWREALRLLVAGCKDDDVNDVLLAILTSAKGDVADVARARAVLAMLCLADEPNVSEAVAINILDRFAASADDRDGNGLHTTSLTRAAIEAACGAWESQLKRACVREFMKHAPNEGTDAGGVWAMVENSFWLLSGATTRECSQRLIARLASGDSVEVISAALSVMMGAFLERDWATARLAKPLLVCFQLGDAGAFAASWAFVQLSHRVSRSLEKEVLEELSKAFKATKERRTAGFLAATLGRAGDHHVVAPLLTRLDDSDVSVRVEVVEALQKLGDKAAIAPLVKRLDDPSTLLRRTVIKALGKLGDKAAVEPLVARLGSVETDRPFIAAALHDLQEQRGMEELKRCIRAPDPETRHFALEFYASQEGDMRRALLLRDYSGAQPLLDAREAITEIQVQAAARTLHLTPAEIRSQYEAIAQDIGLTLAWQTPG